MAVTKTARDCRLVGFLLVAALVLPMALNFVGGSPHGRLARPAKIRVRATSSIRMPLPEFNPLPWATDLQGAEALQHDGRMTALKKCIELHKAGLTSEKLREHDRFPFSYDLIRCLPDPP
eukprot:TRINITY_DN10596_c0_g4_i1.p1 TRINITY_DN10596_c0_g4~~TRINITY_DN10596_c0_g4_i1.p1  ORF type:complete len:120 (+),score=14.55 TRINITY_DN10596_c0_g4_i1:86-445(+)